MELDKIQTRGDKVRLKVWAKGRGLRDGDYDVLDRLSQRVVRPEGYGKRQSKSVRTLRS